MQDQNRRGRFAARTKELLGKDLNEACEADRVLVEEWHDAQTQTLLHLPPQPSTPLLLDNHSLFSVM